MTVENQQATAPQTPPAGAPAKPEAPAQRKIELFTKPDPAKVETKPEAPAEEVKPPEEAAPATEEQAAKKDDAPAPPKPQRRPSNLGAEKARLAKERNEVAAKAAAAEEATKKAAEEKAKAEKELADFRRKEAMVKEDPRALLDLYNVKLEELNKAALNGAPMDPRVLDLRVQLGEVTKKLEEQSKAIEEREKARQAEQIRMQEQFFIEQTKGKIEGALKDDAYELARAAGWTPEEVWEGMHQAFRATGTLPTIEEALKAIEDDELKRYEAVSKAKKVQASAPKPAAPPAPAPKPTTPTLTNKSEDPPPKKPAKDGNRMERLLAFTRNNPLFTK